MRELYWKRVKADNIETYTHYTNGLGFEDLYKTAEGEMEWVNKWTIQGKKPDPFYYRLFKHYVGNDIKIVPEDICRVMVENALNPKKFRKFYADKNSWGLLFQDSIFPATIIRRMDGVFYDNQYGFLHEEEAIEIVKKYKGKMAVKITRDSNSAMGFHTLVSSSDGYIIVDGKKKIEARELVDFLNNNCIVQPFLKQHESLDMFCDTSVNPIRITTYRSVVDDKIHVLNGGVLRIGYKGDENDGTHGNGKYVGIEKDGTLKKQVLDYRGNISTTFNGINFASNEFTIPKFDKIKEIAINVAKKVRHARLLAFDIMLDEGGNPIVFEFNIDDYSIWLAQYTGTPAFGEFTDEILDYTEKHYSDIEQVLLY